jgi:hypothetical protein
MGWSFEVQRSSASVLTAATSMLRKECRLWWIARNFAAQSLHELNGAKKPASLSKT